MQSSIRSLIADGWESSRAAGDQSRKMPMSTGSFLDWCQIAKALTDAVYSSKVGSPTSFRDFRVPVGMLANQTSFLFGAPTAFSMK
jgi:hypothetical protein